MDNEQDAAEWTADYVESLYQPGSYRRFWGIIADAHNASLAKEREKTDPATGETITKPTWAELGEMNQEIQRLREELDDEKRINANLIIQLETSDAKNCSLLAFAAVVKGKPETPQSLKDLASKELCDDSCGAYLIKQLRELRTQVKELLTQLATAQAAFKALRKVGMNCNITDTSALDATIEEATKDLRKQLETNQVAMDLADAHEVELIDAAVAEATKPLVDALKTIKHQAQYKGDHFTLDIACKALAQNKEKP